MKKLILALLSGCLLALSWPTFGFPVFLFIGFIPLLIVEYEIRDVKHHYRKTFLFSFITFFVWNVATTWWIYNSTPFGMWFAEIVNSLLMSLVFLIFHWVAHRASFSIGYLFLACIWLGFEYLHLHWEFSWPWLNLGNGFAHFISWVQWYEYTGTFGGSLWIWIVNIGLFKTYLTYQKTKDKSTLKKPIFIYGLVILIPILLSLTRYYTYEEKEDPVEVLILQPNIDPYKEKYNTTDVRVSLLLDSLSNTSTSDSIKFIVAPETVFADNNRLNEFPYSTALQTAKIMIKNHPGVHILSGISMVDVFKDASKVRKQTNSHPRGFYYDDYNSAFFVRPDGSSELYHKSKLVVGVENFPYQSVLKPILGDAMIDLGGTVAKKTTQEDREVFFTKDSIGAAPIICYESVYGEFVTGYVRNKANFLAIITNDAWWGNTQGHKQHLTYAKLRAVENRRSIVRSANTGISAIINQRGDIIQRLDYEKRGTITGTLNQSDKITFYAKAGDYLARVSIFIGAFILLSAFAKKRGSKNLL